MARPPLSVAGRGTGAAACRSPSAASRPASRRTPRAGRRGSPARSGCCTARRSCPDRARTTSTLDADQRHPASGRARLGAVGLDLTASAYVGGDRLREPFEDAGEPGAAPAGAEDEVGGDQVAGGVVELVGERPQRGLGVPPGAEPGDQPGDLARDRRGVERRVATSACSRPTPTVRTPARERVHSSIASSRSIWVAAGGADSRIGRPMTATGAMTSARTQPVTSQPRTPRPRPTGAASGCAELIASRTARFVVGFVAW